MVETSKGYFPPNFHRSNQGVLPLSLFQQSQNTVHNLKYIDSRRHAKREKVLNTCCCLDMEHALVLHFVLQLQLTFRAFKRSRQPGSGGFLRQQNFMDQGIKRAELFFFYSDHKFADCTFSVAWVPSQYGAEPVCLQPHRNISELLCSASNRTGLILVTLWLPSQNGWGKTKEKEPWSKLEMEKIKKQSSSSSKVTYVNQILQELKRWTSQGDSYMKKLGMRIPNLNYTAEGRLKWARVELNLILKMYYQPLFRKGACTTKYTGSC